MRVAVLLAHPDDELMCAGTLVRFVDRGDRVQLLTLFMDDRLPEWEACTKTLAVNAAWWAQADETEPDFVWSRRTVETLEPLTGAFDLLITHRAEDPNTSHGHIGRVGRTLARKNRADLWELDQTMPGGINPDAPGPNHFVDITGQLVTKRDAIRCYASQIVRYPGLERALEARDRMYGWEIGTATAEAFRVVKSVWL